MAPGHWELGITVILWPIWTLGTLIMVFMEIIGNPIERLGEIVARISMGEK